MNIREWCTRWHKIAFAIRLGWVHAGRLILLPLDFLSRFVLPDISLLLFSCSSVLEPILYMVSYRARGQAMVENTNIDSCIVDSHLLSKLLLGTAVGLVVLLKLGLQNLDLLL